MTATATELTSADTKKLFSGFRLVGFTTRVGTSESDGFKTRMLVTE